MPEAIYYFPRKFLWGTATSAYQIEGLNTNTNWSIWEKTPGMIHNGQTSGIACNWWSGLWREDLNRANSTFQNAHRLSIEWSRIQPEADRWDQSALDHYRQILQGMVDRNITPMVTLHHFTEPLWIYEKGGWENPEIVFLFSEFVRRSVEGLKEFCNHWITINEPNIYVYEGYIEGVFPPGKKDLEAAFYVMENMIKGHSAAYEIIHSIEPASKVGVATNYRPLWPNTKWSPLDRLLSIILNKNFNQAFIDCVMTGKLNFALKSRNINQAKDRLDFIGINYYSADNIKFNLFKPKKLFFESFHPVGSEISENGFISNNPNGLSEAISWASKFNLPIFITENGIEDSIDILRPQYLLEHLYQLWRSANLNPLVKGYFHWTLVDNFEWERGWSQRFGLWGLDINNQTRIRRKTVDLYALICKGNNINPEIVNKFCPDIFKNIYP
jgi:beta-glucosidase